MHCLCSNCTCMYHMCLYQACMTTCADVYCARVSYARCMSCQNCLRYHRSLSCCPCWWGVGLRPCTMHHAPCTMHHTLVLLVLALYSARWPNTHLAQITTSVRLSISCMFAAAPWDSAMSPKPLLLCALTNPPNPQIIALAQNNRVHKYQ